MIENVSTQLTVFHCLCPLPASRKGLRLPLRSALFGEGGRDWRLCTSLPSEILIYMQFFYKTDLDNNMNGHVVASKFFYHEILQRSYRKMTMSQFPGFPSVHSSLFSPNNIHPTC